MGIYDREYYRKEGPSYLDMLVPSGAVCKWLIIINAVIFFASLAITNQGEVWILEWFVLHVPSVLDGEVWRLLSYAFLHANFWHLFWNMLFLWWFGSELEEMYGSREFLCFYLIAAIVGGLAYMLEATVARVGVALGASGSITALLLLYAFHFPHRTILVFLVLPVPIWLFAVFSVLKDVAGLFEPANPVAVAIHLGGAAFAAGYYHFRWRFTGWWSSLMSWRRQRRRPKLRIYHPEERQPVSVGADAGDEQLEAKVDAVLEKVARSGQESLTDQERQILMRASEIYKKKRT